MPRRSSPMARRIANLRGARATDIYTLKGGGPEVY
jgi:hypothetical protein